ncbi:hypothetical protein VTO73DRAFT_11398 [Trametes versicolor]
MDVGTAARRDASNRLRPSGIGLIHNKFALAWRSTRAETEMHWAISCHAEADLVLPTTTVHLGGLPAIPGTATIITQESYGSGRRYGSLCPFDQISRHRAGKAKDALC